MRSLLCHRVPFATLLLALGLAGCFGSHGSEPGVDAGTTGDAAVPRTDGGRPTPRDASPRPVDAGPFPSDAGLTCTDHRADLTCLSHVSAGVESRLQVLIGGEDACYCGETVGCVAERTGPRSLSLRTALCVGDVLCDGCFHFVEGTCLLPPLDEGTYAVDIDGSYAYDLDVLPAGVEPERGETCIRTADDGGACGTMPPPTTGRHGLLCHESVALPGERVPLRVTDSCGSCGLFAGPCTVEVFDSNVVVHPSGVFGACDVDCPAVCMPREDVCYTPPLETGRYRVTVEGIPGYESTLDIGAFGGDPATVCGPVVAGG